MSTATETGVVVLVDDEPPILAALKRLVRHEPWQVHTFSRPADALAFLEQHEADVVVADFRMPEMNGVELLRRVRELRPNAQRVMLTGYADPHALEDAVNRSEVFRFVSKPWDDQLLRLELRAAMESSRSRRESTRLQLQLREQVAVEQRPAPPPVDDGAVVLQVLGGWLHDLNGALAPLQAFAVDLASTPGHSADDQEAIEAIVESSRRAVKLSGALQRTLQKSLAPVNAGTPATAALDDAASLLKAALPKNTQLKVEPGPMGAVVFESGGAVRRRILTALVPTIAAPPAVLTLGIQQQGDTVLLRIHQRMSDGAERAEALPLGTVEGSGGEP